MATVHIVGTSRHSLDRGTGDLEPHRRRERAALVGGVGRPAQLHRRAAEPGRALLGLAAAPRTAPPPARSSAPTRPGAAMPGVAEERALADPGRLDAQPAAARARRTRPWCRRRGTRRRRPWSSSAAAARSTPRRRGPTSAPSAPQPHRGEQAGVQREEQRAGGVHEPLGGPGLPADPAAHRVVALAQPEAEQPDDHDRQHGVGDQPGRASRAARPPARRPPAEAKEPRVAGRTRR